MKDAAGTQARRCVRSDVAVRVAAALYAACFVHGETRLGGSDCSCWAMLRHAPCVCACSLLSPLDTRVRGSDCVSAAAMLQQAYAVGHRTSVGRCFVLLVLQDAFAPCRAVARVRAQVVCQLQCALSGKWVLRRAARACGLLLSCFSNARRQWAVLRRAERAGGAKRSSTRHEGCRGDPGAPLCAAVRVAAALYAACFVHGFIMFL